MKYAVVTIAIGKPYIEKYNHHFRKNTEAYCKRNGYDLVLITEYLLPSKYPIYPFVNIMKWTLPYRTELQQYDRIMIVDADILLTPGCIPFHTIELNGKIGVVDEYSQPSPSMRIDIQRACGYETSASEYYKKHTGLTFETTRVLNGGLYICSPAIHGPFFKTIFEANVDGTFTCPGHPYHYEQGMFGYELQTRQMYKLLDNSWNCILPILAHPTHIGQRNKLDYAKELYSTCNAIHFCGGEDWNFTDHLRSYIPALINMEAICNTSVETNRLKTLSLITDHYKIQPGCTTYGADAQSHPYYSKFNCLLNARSLAINHIVLLEKHKNSNKPLLIFESDVLCIDPLNHIDAKLQQIINDMAEKKIDFIFLGKGCFSSVNTSDRMHIVNDLYKSNTSRCTEAYLISPTGIQAYLDYFNSTDNHTAIDADYNIFFKAYPHISCAWTIPELFRQGSMDGTYQSLVPLPF
jgi:hypothetical protein